MRKILIDAYLDYRNNYLTIKRYGEHNGLTPEQASDFIKLARSVFDSQHPDA